MPPQYRLTYLFIAQLIIDGDGQADQKDVEVTLHWTQFKSVFNVNDGKWTADWYIKDKKSKSVKWQPPTLLEVEDFLADNGCPNEGVKFINFYESKGWMIGKNKMKDWRAACRNWAARKREEANAKQPTNDKLTGKIKRSDAAEFADSFKVK
jgi:hypothetical protein